MREVVVALFAVTHKSHKSHLNPIIIGRDLPTGGIFKQECEVSAKLNLTPVILVYQGLQVFLILNNFTFDSICASFVHHCQNLGHQAGLQHDSPT